MPISALIEYTSPDSLHTRSVQTKRIKCLKLTIHEMNEGTRVAMGGLIGKRLEIFEHVSAIRDFWSQDQKQEEACPLDFQTKYCVGRDEDKLYDFQSSLSLCHCDELCGRFGDCCMDFDVGRGHDTVPDEVQVKCVSTHNYRQNQIFIGIGFYVITSCSKWFHDDKIKSKCVSPKLGKESNPALRLPVEINGLTYRNAFCALCNSENVTEEHFWRLEIPGGLACRKLFHDIKLGGSLDFSPLDNGLTCSGDSVSYPNSNGLYGRNRLGKLCLFDDDDKSRDKNQGRKNFLLLMHHDRVEAVDSPCFCRHCGPILLPFVTSNMNKIMHMMRNFQNWLFLENRVNLGHSGFLWSIMEEASVKRGMEDHSDRLFGVLVISLTGSGTSIFFFSSMIVHLTCTGVISKAKRCQLGIAVSKLAFFLALCGGTAFRRVTVVCKAFALLIHYALLVSFCYVAWYGVQVAHLLWQLNHNMAALTVENREPGLSQREVLLTIGVWIGPLGAVVILWCIEQFSHESPMHYGLEGYCMLTGERGRLFFIALPASIVVTIGVGNLVFSLIQFVKLRDKPMDKEGFFALVKFLMKLIVFQSLQWIFGVIFFFTANSTSKFIFELLVSFDGLLMALSYFSDVMRKFLL